MATYRKIPLQKWKLFWFSLRHAFRAGKAKTVAQRSAHRFLAQLAVDAIKSIENGTQEKFMLELERLEKTREELYRALQEVRERYNQ